MDLLRELVENSMLTERQLQSLESYMKVISGELRLREAAAQAPGGPVTVGSYYRTVGQARKNVRRSLTTVLIALWVGAVELENVQRLLQTGAGKVAQLSGEDEERFLGVLGALLDKVVL